MMSAYLMFFYTNVLGVAATVAGGIMMITCVIDSFTDIGMGILVNRTNTKWERVVPGSCSAPFPLA